MGKTTRYHLHCNVPDPGRTFCWHDSRAAWNLLRHRVPFEEGAGVFFDPDAARAVVPPLTHTVRGRSVSGRLLEVAYCVSGDARIWILGASRAPEGGCNRAAKQISCVS